ncbi:MAG: tripartite tricarboxylate transporter TctB family protein [Desulfobacterales bacterium]|nr:tripartite tricarboxylate transporter TctB family protein [Desulfobacterales bacterium]
MKRADRISSIFWMILSIGLIKWGLDLDLGTLSAPDAGFMIFGVGVAMLGLSLAIFIQTFLSKTQPGERRRLWSGQGWRKVLFVLASLLVYAHLLVPLGFLPTTFLLLLFLFKWIEPHKWGTAIGVSAVMVSVAYVVFAYWLGCQLPKGLFDFL